MSTDTAFALGAAGARRAAVPRPAARVHAHRRRRRRPRRARRDRDGLHRGPPVAGCSSAWPVRASSSCSCALGVRRGLVCRVLGAATWIAMLESGVEPVVVGLAMGLLTYAYPSRALRPRARDGALPRFREQPTPELALEAPGRAPFDDLTERAPAAPLAPVDELPDRAAVRARERRRRRRPGRARTPSPRRSRSGSCSATWWGSRSGSSGVRTSPPG